MQDIEEVSADLDTLDIFPLYPRLLWKKTSRYIVTKAFLQILAVSSHKSAERMGFTISKKTWNRWKKIDQDEIVVVQNEEALTTIPYLRGEFVTHYELTSESRIALNKYSSLLSSYSSILFFSNIISRLSKITYANSSSKHYKTFFPKWRIATWLQMMQSFTGAIDETAEKMTCTPDITEIAHKTWKKLLLLYPMKTFYKLSANSIATRCIHYAMQSRKILVDIQALCKSAGCTRAQFRDAVKSTMLLPRVSPTKLTDSLLKRLCVVHKVDNAVCKHAGKILRELPSRISNTKPEVVAGGILGYCSIVNGLHAKLTCEKIAKSLYISVSSVTRKVKQIAVVHGHFIRNLQELTQKFAHKFS